jgi:hypothetical protein
VYSDYSELKIKTRMAGRRFFKLDMNIKNVKCSEMPVINFWELPLENMIFIGW